MDSIHKEWIDEVAHQPNFVKVKTSSWVGRGLFHEKRL